MDSWLLNVWMSSSVLNSEKGCSGMSWLNVVNGRRSMAVDPFSTGLLSQSGTGSALGLLGRQAHGGSECRPSRSSTFSDWSDSAALTISAYIVITCIFLREPLCK